MSGSAEEKKTPHRTLFERLGINDPALAKELQKHKNRYLWASVFYAVEDAKNLSSSFCGIGFAMKSSFHGLNDAHSTSDFYDFVDTPEGFVITFVGTGALILASALGTYYADAVPEKDGFFLCFLGEFWPYVRDSLKAMKWAYKGIRNTLMLVLHYADNMAMLYHILFPITIVCGVLAVLVRAWIRQMRSQRKAMMRYNELLSAEIAAQTNSVSVLAEKPEEKNLAIYANRLIAVKEDEDYRLYHVVEHSQSYKLNALTEKDEDAKQFTDQLILFQNEALIQQLKPFLHQTVETENVELQRYGDQLYFCEDLPNQGDHSYRNAVVYVYDSASSHKGLYVYDQAGNRQDAPDDLRRRFDNALLMLQNDPAILGFSRQQYNRLHQKLPFLKEKAISHPSLTYSDWSSHKKQFDDKKQAGKQSPYTVFLAYLAVIYTGLIDSLYFYMGVFFISMFNPMLFSALVAISVTLFVACMIGRIYEEYDYQKKLHRTQINVEMSMCATEIRFINLELDNIMTQADQQARVKELLACLFKKVKEYKALQEQYEQKIVLSWSACLIEGLRSGLGLQGVIVSSMFLIVVIMTLATTPCPPIVIFAFMVAGMVAFCASAVQFVVSYRHYLATIRDKQNAQIKEEGRSYSHWEEDFEKFQDNPERQKELLLKARMSIERCALDHIQQFALVGWWEVIRQSLRGVEKADKTYLELTLDRSEPRHDSSFMLMLSVLFSASMGVAFMLRTIAKTFAESAKSAAVTFEKFVKTTEQPGSSEHPSSIARLGHSTSAMGVGLFPRSGDASPVLGNRPRSVTI